MPILTDLSGTMYAALHVDISHGGGNTVNEKYIRHLVINSLLSYNRKFKEKYGELHICFDHGSWRKRFFEYYKWVRYNNLEKDDNDWEHIHECMERICDELIKHFPYPCVRQRYAEGDDVIAVLTDHFVEQGEKVLIVSNDKDMVSKTTHSLVDQFRPMTNDYYTVDDPTRFETELIMTGDKADGVPNIKSPDDFYKTQHILKYKGEKVPRAKSITAKYKAGFVDIISNPNHTEAEIQEYLGDDYTNYLRNKKLISLDQIPDVMRDAILNTYSMVHRNKIMDTLNYFNTNNMHLFAKEIKGFEPKRKPQNRLFG